MFQFQEVPNLTMEFIESSLSIWNWYEISANPNITMELIEATPG